MKRIFIVLFLFTPLVVFFYNYKPNCSIYVKSGNWHGKIICKKATDSEFVLWAANDSETVAATVDYSTFNYKNCGDSLVFPDSLIDKN